MDLATTYPAMTILGRAAVGGLYLVAGIEHLFSIGALSKPLSERGIPLPVPSLICASVFQSLAGLAVMLGIGLPWSALSLVAFTVVAGIVMIDFWNKKGEERAAGILAWQSNVAIMGALLIIAASHAAPLIA